MKLRKNIFKVAVCTSLLFISFGCGSNWLDINKDPNAATEPNARLMLPIAQASIFSALGDGLNGFGNPAAVFVHQHNQRTANDNYGIAPGSISILNGWNNAYTSGLENLSEIIKVSEPRQDFAYSGVAKILKAITFAYLVDVFGDVPFSQANQALKFPNPKYDKGSDVYDGALKLLDEGIADLAKSNTSNVPGANDLVYGGNLDSWRKAAKSYKLRLYNQMRRVRNVNAQVTALIAENDFITASEDFRFVYGTNSAPENRHPMYVSEYLGSSRLNHISPYFYEIMVNNSAVVVNGDPQISNPIYKGIADPRVPYYFCNQRLPTQAAQNPVEYRLGGMISIYFNSNGANRDFDQSNSLGVVGLYPCGGKYDNGLGGAVGLTTTSGAGGMQRLLPFHSLLFTRAELAQAGVSGENARDLFIRAINAAFAEVNEAAGLGRVPALSQTAIDAYRNAVVARFDLASDEGKLEHIMTQKWISNYGNALESYNDVRRTGFPKTFVKSMPGVPAFVLNGSGVFPFSFPYTQREIDNNSTNVQQKLIATPAAKVFWQP